MRYLSGGPFQNIGLSVPKQDPLPSIYTPSLFVVHEQFRPYDEEHKQQFDR